MLSFQGVTKVISNNSLTSLNNFGKKNKPPVIQVEVEGVFVRALIDTGCELCCISEQFFDTLMQVGNKISVLPLTDVSVIGAIGSKTKKVTRQTYLSVKYDTASWDIICLIVSDLRHSLILGADWLYDNKAYIDFEKFTLKVYHVEKPVTILFENSEVESQPVTTNFTNMHCTNIFNLTLIEEQRSLENLNSQDDIFCKEGNIYLGQGMVGLNINESEKQQLYNLISKYKEIFSDKPGLTNVYEHKIVLKDYTPFHVKGFPIPISQKQLVQNKIDEMLSMGIIENSYTNYINPIVPIIKKDGSVRICLDARKLNSQMKMDYECPNSPEEIFYRFENKTVFISTCDLTSSFWQIPLRKSDRKYTGFIFNNRVYQFKVMPFGLCTSVAGITRCLSEVIGPCYSFLSAYVDDILVTSNSFQDHLEHLEQLFARLKQANMTLKINKCIFLRKEVKYLGHILSCSGILPDPEKISAITNFPRPRNLKTLRGFLGLCNYHRKFSENYAILIAPMNNLLRKHVKWKWDKNIEQSFQKTKEAFIKTTMLHHPDTNKPFYLQTDASNVGISARLFQRDDQAEEKVIFYGSRLLKPAEVNYTTCERETLAIVFFLRKWRTLLLGMNLIILTDCKALTFLLRCKLLNSRLIRWALTIQEYTFEIKHCTGKENVVADILSRYPENSNAISKSERTIEIAYLQIHLDKNIVSKLKMIRTEQLADIKLEKIIRQFKNNTYIQREKGFKFKYSESILFARYNENENWRVVVPDSLINNVIEAYHETFGHFGSAKIYFLITQHFIWANMRRKIIKIINSCKLCQEVKNTNKNLSGKMSTIIPEDDKDILAIDIFGPLPTSTGGVKYVLVVLNVFTKFVKLYALRKATTNAIINRLSKEYFPNILKPKRILADNGTQFSSIRWKKFLLDENIQYIYCSVRYPQGNPSERVMRELGRLFRTYCHSKHSAWAQWLKKIENLINCVCHDSTGFSPMELQLGINPVPQIYKLLNLSERQTELSKEVKLTLAKKRLLTKAEKRIKRHNMHKKHVVFAKGDMVWVKSNHISCAEDKEIKKFFKLYEGPYKITKCFENNSYQQKKEKKK